MITLTKHQIEIKDEILSLLKSGEKRIVLNGSAGVGKTTCVDSIIKEFKKNKSGVVKILAPTNKAVSVLKEKSKEESDKNFQTVHQALNLKRVISEVDGSVSFEEGFSYESPFKNTNLIIIDEASMLNSFLIDCLDNFDIPIIFIGDKAQLPPVGEKESEIFLKKYPSLELTEIIRQAAQNPIISISRNLSNISKFEDNITDDDLGYCYLKNEEDCYNIIFEDIENTKFLAWTNAEVNYRNKVIRSIRYGEHASLIENGEIIIMKEPFGLYYTSQEIKVERLEIKESPFTIVFRGKETNKPENFSKSSMSRVFKYYLINGEIPIIHEDSQELFKKTLKTIKELISQGIAKWTDFYKFKERFAYFDYSYAITVHKSQGSTYKNVIVNYRDLNRNRDSVEAKKLWYTAVTRASNLLFFYL